MCNVVRPNMKCRWYDVGPVATGLWLSSVCSMILIGVVLKRKILGRYTGMYCTVGILVLICVLGLRKLNWYWKATLSL